MSDDEDEFEIVFDSEVDTIEFAPGAFDDFEGTQEELDQLIKELTEMARTGELFENSVPLTDEEVEDLLERDKTIQ